MPRVLAAGRGVRPSPEDAHPGGPPGSAASTGRGRGAGGHRAGAHGGTCAGDKFRQQVKTTASGHTACASVSTRSARPTWPPRVISSAANHTSRPSSAPAATAETAGRGPPGTQDPRLSPPSGQTVRAIKPIAAQNACAGEPPLAGSGVAATSTPAIPPAIRMSRPGTAAGLSARPVTTSQTPTASSTSVITHRSAAPSAARELMVLATALTERGCSPAAKVHPPTRSTGAAAEETTPHQGTTSMTTTIGAGGLASASRPVGEEPAKGTSTPAVRLGQGRRRDLRLARPAVNELATTNTSNFFPEILLVFWV